MPRNFGIEQSSEKDSMNLPTKSQVDSFSRHAITAAGTAIAMLGLQAKGFDVAQVTAMIQALGSTVNDLILLIGAAATMYASLKAAHSASPTSQAISVAATGALVVTTPEIAAATPDSPNVVSSADVKVSQK
jgi:hypothetical protein